MDKFTEPTKALVFQDSLVYTYAKGRTSIRFTAYAEYAARDIADTDTESTTYPIIDFNNVNMAEEIKDKIIYPKELGMMDLSKKELLELEEDMYMNKQLTEEEYLYYDNEKNIRICLINEKEIEQEDLESQVESEMSYQKTLMEAEYGSSSSFQAHQAPTPNTYTGEHRPRFSI